MEAYIVDAVRTAGGKREGALKDWHPADLGAAVLNALVDRTGIDPSAIDDVIAGCVGQIGEQSFHIGRNMVIWYVKSAATRPSGNELFDDSVRSMLLKLLEDKTALPAPPPEVDEQYRGRRIQINIVGPHGDPSRCK